MSISTSLAFSTMALANGCSLKSSQDATIFNKSVSLKSSLAGIMSDTCRLP